MHRSGRLLPHGTIRSSLTGGAKQSVDGRFTVSGHENGGVYIFNNDTGRLLHSLPGTNRSVLLLGLFLKQTRSCETRPRGCLLPRRQTPRRSGRRQSHRPLRCLLRRASREPNGSRGVGHGAGLERYRRVFVERVSSFGHVYHTQLRMMLICTRQGIRWQSQGMVHRSADMCGDAHGDREDAVGGEVAAEDREERRVCYGGSEPKHFFL